MSSVVTQERVRELFDYVDGNLVWKKNQQGHAKAGDIVGAIAECNGIKYCQTKISGKQIKVHRLIFLWHHGYLPLHVDHIDGDGLNNRIENLRPASISENAANSRVRSSNTSGAKNVYWNKQRGKWMVQATVQGKQKFFGLFEDFELAELVALEVREKFHGQFARHC